MKEGESGSDSIGEGGIVVASEGTPVLSPMVGKIVDIKVKVGDTIKEDDEIATIEAMKMEMPIPAPCSGTIKEILVSVGDTVQAEQPIVIIE